MKLNRGQELPQDEWMFWCWAANPKANPFVFFEDKYGYTPTLVSIGANVDIEIPEGIEQAQVGIVTIPGHIKLR